MNNSFKITSTPIYVIISGLANEGCPRDRGHGFDEKVRKHTSVIRGVVEGKGTVKATSMANVTATEL